MNTVLFTTVLPVVLHLLVSGLATLHVLLHKESSRAAVGWVGLIWLSPFLGPTAYLVLGVNRVARKGARLALDRTDIPLLTTDHRVDAHRPDEPLPGVAQWLDGVTHHPLLGGNRVTVLNSGEQTYPAMIAAIDAATHSVAMQTFILERDRWGRAVLDALDRAHDRGVAVRFLLDGVGTLFSWPSALDWLRASRFPWARFLWTWDLRRMALVNLRNHRKILVVDGCIGFTGGMNIRASFDAEHHPEAHRDLHVRVEGPGAASLLDAFRTDWTWTTGETLHGEAWAPRPPAPCGDDTVRAIPDGPDEDLGDAEQAFLAGLACARRSVRITTPYFLPEEGLTTALANAARRGIDVRILLPGRTNQPLTAWAMMDGLRPLLAHGVAIAQSPGPFDHTKAMVVDDCWSVVGSANWDPRSLRLNFELQLEVWSPTVAKALTTRFDQGWHDAIPVTKQTLDARWLGRRIRDGLARLLAPYL